MPDRITLTVLISLLSTTSLVARLIGLGLEFPTNPLAPVVENMPLEACDGDMLTVTVSTEVQANRYFWFDGGRVPIDTTTGPFRAFQISQGINTFHTSYEDTNGCPSDTTMFTIEGVALPGTPAIEGLTSVCVGDTVQVYRTETAADTYQWGIVPGTGRIEGPSTLDSVAVVWDPGAGASAGVSLTVANLSGTGRLTCPAQPVSLPVLVRGDVTFFELSGENMACNGELGTLALSGSQPDSTYVLFIDGERSQDPADTMAGTGGILTWTGLETGREYTVFLETQDCGSFPMNGSLSIGGAPGTTGTRSGKHATGGMRRRHAYRHSIYRSAGKPLLLV